MSEQMNSLTYLVLTGGVSGLLVPLAVSVLFSRSVDWKKQLAGPTWDFSRSWASNMTAVGTVLTYGTILSCFAPTASLHFFSRQAYLGIGAVAGSMSVLAPLTFLCLSRILAACRFKAAVSIAFLVGAGVTIWGLTLQLLIGACTLWEMKIGNFLPVLVSTTFVVLIIAFAISVITYAILSAADTLKKETPLLAVAAQPDEHANALQLKAWALL
jgi:hypothetical protein